MRICQMILQKARALNKGIITFLMWLRKDHVQWYQQRCVLRPHLELYTYVRLLKKRNSKGKTAYDYFNEEFLQPIKPQNK